MIGAIAIGLFASAAVNPPVHGLLYGNAYQLGVQLLAVVVVAGFAFFGTYAILKVVDRFSPLRVSPKEEEAGLDISQHGEEAYHVE
jgi:Amt family ammonium transporter